MTDPDLAYVCHKCGGFYQPNEVHICKYLDPLLRERQRTHGSFQQNAAFSQHFKRIFQTCKDYANQTEGMTPAHREALDMIALKLSRILSGQANFKDHWDDIAGYAKLGSEACGD